jgi:phosphoserine phosphatase RsbU/P
MSEAQPSRAWLIPLPGSLALEPMELVTVAGKIRFVVGRSKDCDFRLPMEAEEVSRRHAEFVYQDGQWGIADLQSRWGTVVNGMKIAPHRLVQIGEGDLIHVHPWTFRFSIRRASSASVIIEEDNNASMVRTLAGDSAEPLRQDMLNLLLDASLAILTAENEVALTDVLTDMARRGTGLANAAVLRALDANGNAEPIVSGQPPAIRFSRSLLSAAARGVVAEFCGAMNVNVAHSLEQANVRAAICAPLMLGQVVAGYLYAESHGPVSEGIQTLRPNAGGFCQALARMGALAMANLKRLETERRAAEMEAELKAAAAAQRWILPVGPIVAGPFRCTGQTQPGGYLGGDFFDAQVLGDGRLAVTLGDVSGHGAAPSVLMTAAQGFLHASMADHADLARAVGNLNSFLRPRCPDDKFITLWSGLFDPKQMTLRYVDAGHGYAMLIKADGSLQKLDENGGPPIGVAGNYQYEEAIVRLPAGGRLLVISDGLVEQPAAEVPQDGVRRQFGVDGVGAAIRAAGHDNLLDQIFGAVRDFAGDANLADDATGILVQWSLAGDF